MKIFRKGTEFQGKTGESEASVGDEGERLSLSQGLP